MKEETRLYDRPIGFYNLGNTCYMNAALQMITNCAPLKQYYLQSDPMLDKIVDDNRLGRNNRDRLRLLVSRDLRALMGHVHHPSRRAIFPKDLVRHMALLDARFSGRDQQDPHDFLVTLLDEVDEALQMRVKGHHTLVTRGVPGAPPPPSGGAASPVQAIFRGEVLSAVECLRCRHVSRMKEPFVTLELALPQDGASPFAPRAWVAYVAGLLHWLLLLLWGWLWRLLALFVKRQRKPAQARPDGVQLQDCLAEHCKAESLHGENEYECDRCRAKVPARKEVSLSSLPGILLIEIKRFQKVPVFGWFTKISTHVNFPMVLDLSAHVNKELAPGSSSNMDMTYECCGVVTHHGGYSGGHYTAFVRDPCKERIFYCDDEYVEEADAGDMSASQAYMLLYRRTKSAD